MRLITVGKSETNDITLSDNAVSRLHMEIFIDDNEKIFVTDKESTNGTFINGNRIVGSKMINRHDIIKAANTIVNWKRYILDDKRTVSNNIESYNQEDSQYPLETPKRRIKGVWWFLIVCVLIVSSILFYLNTDSVKIRGVWIQDDNNLISYSFHANKSFIYDSLGDIKTGTYQLNTKDKIINLSFDSASLPPYPYTITTLGKMEPLGRNILAQEFKRRFPNIPLPQELKLREIGNVFNISNKTAYNIKILSMSPLLRFITKAEQKIGISDNYNFVINDKFNTNNFKPYLLESKFHSDENGYLINNIDNLIIPSFKTISIFSTVDKEIFADIDSDKNKNNWYSDDLVNFSYGMLVYRFSKGNRNKSSGFTTFNGKIVLGEMNPTKEFNYFIQNKTLRLDNKYYSK